MLVATVVFAVTFVAGMLVVAASLRNSAKLIADAIAGWQSGVDARLIPWDEVEEQAFLSAAGVPQEEWVLESELGQESNQ